MKMITRYALVLVLLISAQSLFSQENKQQQIDSLKVQKERVVLDEKSLLKEEAIPLSPLGSPYYSVFIGSALYIVISFREL